MGIQDTASSELEVWPSELHWTPEISPVPCRPNSSSGKCPSSDGSGWQPG